MAHATHPVSSLCYYYLLLSNMFYTYFTHDQSTNFEVGYSVKPIITEVAYSVKIYLCIELAFFELI